MIKDCEELIEKHKKEICKNNKKSMIKFVKSKSKGNNYHDRKYK